MPNLWTKIDIPLLQNPPFYLDVSDDCYFAREFVSGGGFQAGDGNQRILNFKKKPDTRGTTQWPHRTRAVEQFAGELAEFIPIGSVVATIPTSKPAGHPEYCDRFDVLAARLIALRQDLRFVTPIRRVLPAQPLHAGARRRSVEDVAATLMWIGLPFEPVTRLFLIDDVITAGTTFKAYQRVLRDNSPMTLVTGVFWARTVWPVQEEVSPLECDDDWL